ncbi:unnamed protein product [Notodromas monacha]|uniref:Uncharacterized protein n=1 Tax=Notodromas monacha TaxID=399045 RepID=A0A7R9BSR5_9CRUS|nr:unnamed protein product [Notodromas monacha]CAG0920013.1 unnamed protein product [Notodromas monacha]
MIVKGDSLPPPKELTGPVIFDDWKDVEAFADRHFELYAQTHLGRYSFRMADKRREWAKNMKNELRISELQELDFHQLLEKDTGDIIIPLSILGPLHPAGTPPVEPFFPIDKRKNGKDVTWTDVYSIPWVVYPDGRSDLLLDRPLGGPRIKDRERERELQRYQMVAGKMAAGGGPKVGDEAKKMIDNFAIPEPKFVPKSPQQIARQSAAMRRTARSMDCVRSIMEPEHVPPRDKLASSPSYVMEGFDFKDTINVINFDQDSRAANAGRFRSSGRSRRRSPAGPFPDTIEPHCPVHEVYADGEPCDPLSVPPEQPDKENFLVALWKMIFPSCAEDSVKEPEPCIDGDILDAELEEEEETSSGKLKAKEEEQPFPFGSYPDLTPHKHILKYTWKNEVQPTGPGLAGGDAGATAYLNERRRRMQQRIYGND